MTHSKWGVRSVSHQKRVDKYLEIDFPWAFGFNLLDNQPLHIKLYSAHINRKQTDITLLTRSGNVLLWLLSLATHNSILRRSRTLSSLISLPQETILTTLEIPRLQELWPRNRVKTASVVLSCHNIRTRFIDFKKGGGVAVFTDTRTVKNIEGHLDQFLF